MKTVVMQKRKNQQSILAGLLALILAAGIFSAIFALPVQAANLNASNAQTLSTTNAEWNKEVLRLVNIERAKAGLNELVYNNSLESYAYVRAKEIFTYFEHTRPNGKSTFDGQKNLHGENLGLYALSPAEIVRAWMASPSHKANILEPRFASMAVANLIPLNDLNGISWVQHFSVYSG